MKTLTLATTLLSLFLTSHAQAAGNVAAKCATSDAKYNILIGDAEGSTPGLLATITFSDGSLVATYPVEAAREGSISFGHWLYKDTASNGKLFQLSGRSTNVKSYQLRAETDDAEIVDGNVQCAIFQGHKI